MANKDFGVKKIELIGSSGTPNLTSPTNLNLNANTVAISTDVTIGGKVQSNVIVGTGYSVGIGSTLPQQALDVSGTIRATAFVKSDGSAIGSGGGVTGVTIREEGSVVGVADSITDINFVSGNLTATASGAGATVTLSDTPSFTSAVVGSAVTINSTGVNVVGTVTATSFAGDGSQLTNIGAGTTSEWTLGADGTSNYTFTGPGLTGAENDPTLYLVRGQSYRFTNNMGAHPFRIQSTVNGSTGTQYNDGITNNDVSNGTLIWDVQFDAPKVLYYQCTSHSSMGGPIFIIGEDEVSPSYTDVNVSGVLTVSQGRIQANAASNLRFGNLAAGSGSGRNIAIGDQVLGSLSSGNGRNIGIGELSLNNVTSGGYNVGLGIKAGQLITNGQYNVVLGGYDGNSGNLDIRTLSNRVVIADGEGNIRQYIANDGKVGINTTVLTEMLTVSGVVSATSFHGTLLSSQLTGALPALDGSALTGVSAVGSGVEVKDDDSAVGAAATINFGSRLSVSAVSAGIVTITADAADIPGINTTGTSVFDVLDIGGAVTIDGLTKIGTAVTFNATSGIVSATEFYGDGSNLRNVPAASVYVDESEDDNANYDIVFLDVNAGDAQRVMQVDTGAFTFNPSTGRVTASSFGGSASGLTNVPAGELTGTLPAIDGSALLNVNATGDGVVVENSGSNIGSAKTINFDTGLDVTYSSGIATVTASGGSLQTRTRVSGTTTSIANNGIGNTDITGFKSYALMKVGLSTAGWIRIYTDSASRTADASRSVGEDPAAGSGVIAEVVTTGISTQQNISPFTMGGNMDDPVSTTIYLAVTNLSGSTQAIEANLTILQLEA